METEQQPQETPSDRRLVSGSARRMFRWSEFVHIGDGAEECPSAIHLKDGGQLGDVPECDAPDLHVHVWCRLPNQFQHREIREKSLAAKARRIRQLKDPNCDAYEILENELDALVGSREILVEEILLEEFANDYPEAIQAVEDDERFQHISHDRERYAELLSKDEAERPADEMAELERHIRSYVDAVQAEVEIVQKPRREALTGLDEGELINMVREKRIESDSQEAFLHTYAMMEWFAGTFALAPVGIDKRPTAHHFSSVETMKEAAPELVDGLQATFEGLQRAMQLGSLGNS